MRTQWQAEPRVFRQVFIGAGSTPTPCVAALSWSRMDIHREGARRWWALATARRRWDRQQRCESPSAARSAREHGWTATCSRDAYAISSTARPPKAPTLAQLEQCALRSRSGGRIAVDRTVHVSGLRGENETVARLASLFEDFGRVATVTVRPRGEPPRGKPVGVALISFHSAVAARHVLGRPVAPDGARRLGGRLGAAGLTVRPLEAHGSQNGTGGLVVHWHRGNDALIETIPEDLLQEHAARCMLDEVDRLVSCSLAEAARPRPSSAASVVQSTPPNPVGPLAGCKSETNALGPPSYVASLLSPRSDVAQVARREEVWWRIHAASVSASQAVAEQS